MLCGDINFGAIKINSGGIEQSLNVLLLVGVAVRKHDRISEFSLRKGTSKILGKSVLFRAGTLCALLTLRLFADFAQVSLSCVVGRISIRKELGKGPFVGMGMG